MDTIASSENKSPASGSDGKQILSFGRSPKVFLIFLALVVVSVISIAACSSGSKEAADFEFKLYQGEEALGSNTLKLSDLRGKPVVLNFWAGLCPPCRAEMPDLQAFYNEFHDEATLLGVDIGPFVLLGTKEDARDLLEELRITYPAGYV